MPGMPRRGAAVPVPRTGTRAHVIANSHQRCAALGLHRGDPAGDLRLPAVDLHQALERHQRLCSHAVPVMEMLYEQIVDTQSMVLLTDASGTILHTVGDADFVSRAARVTLQPGANWSEAAQGTNAIGTALVDELPTLVHADEHYIRANHFLTCSATPILDPRGQLLGVLDVSGDWQGYHPHTMALVTLSARMIENHWLDDDHRHALRLHFHRRPEFIGTLTEGILAVSPEGRIVGANRGAQELLGLGGAALRAHTTDSLFEMPVGLLVDRSRSTLGHPLPLTLPDGRRVFAQARLNRSAWTASTLSAQPVGAPATHHAAPAAVPPSPDRALTALRSGDAQIDAVIDKIERVLDRDIPILLLGETGTGKEVFARAIHHDSQRSGRPFVAVNCASIPETLIEAELFGYEEGAFTGARRRGAVGKIVQAHGGVLFLDEIGDMPLSLQAHLLRVLQERQVTPLGGHRPIPVDVTVLCATHRDLRAMIDARSFREDLYYRLNGLALRLPPLRERSDLPALVQRLLTQLSPGHALRLSPEVRRLFQAFHWPGNVRQLFNVLRTASVMAGACPDILVEHLPDDFLEEARTVLAASAATTARPAEATSRFVAKPLQSQADDAIRAALERVGGNVSEAARQLGVSRNTVYRTLRRSPP